MRLPLFLVGLVGLLGIVAAAIAGQPGDLTRRAKYGDSACVTQAVPAVPADAQRVFAVAKGTWYEAGTVVVETCPGYRPAVVPTNTGAGVFFTRVAFDALAAEMAKQQNDRDRALARIRELDQANVAQAAELDVLRIQVADCRQRRKP